MARQADALGFESIWLFDHFHTVPKPTDELTFESFTSLTALAPLTERVLLGHIVICNGFRNPALVAKMASTLDTISGGRMQLGIGAGWKREEWLALRHEFPPTGERLAMLHDALEVVTRMLEPERTSRATFEVRTRASAARSTCRSRFSRPACRSWSAVTVRRSPGGWPPATPTS